MTGGDLVADSQYPVLQQPMTSIPACQRAPSEVWGMIISSVLFVPLNDLLFQRWEARTHSGIRNWITNRHHTSYLLQKQILRLVCRSWKEFIDGPCDDSRLSHMWDVEQRGSDEFSFENAEWLSCSIPLACGCFHHPRRYCRHIESTTTAFKQPSLAFLSKNEPLLWNAMADRLKDLENVLAISVSLMTVNLKKSNMRDCISPNIIYLDLDVVVSISVIPVIAEECPRLEGLKLGRLNSSSRLTEKTSIVFRNLTHLTLEDLLGIVASPITFGFPKLNRLSILGSEFQGEAICEFASMSLQQVRHISLASNRETFSLPDSFWTQFPQLEVLDIHCSNIIPTEPPADHPIHTLGWYSERPSSAEMMNVESWLWFAPQIRRVEMSFSLMEELDFPREVFLNFMEYRLSHQVVLVDSDDVQWDRDKLPELREAWNVTEGSD